ncbi:hypothetical protein KUTeg_015520 [Tegillarca granosa]|uniref:Uncharacterized protein n=1 Tax=Tegillarca granosa TaxID=220873 RepID=A0ABQ9EU06_TEGGR|nr:hypothetical protein KUTeg_015520 [Tegillarca granosa]
MIVKLKKFWSCFMITLLFTLADSFLPNHYVNFLSGNDYTHADITEKGILEAVAEYFEQHTTPRKTAFSTGTLTKIPDITARKLYQYYYEVKGRREKVLKRKNIF